MRLANPELLLLFLLFPLWWGAAWAWRRKRPGATRPTLLFANFPALANATSGFRSRLARVPHGLRAAALAVLIVAVARPQAEDWQTLVGAGMDIMICLDMSGSMNAVDMGTEEIADYQTRGQEPPNRFEVARQALKQFVANRKGDRIGLVVFANEAYLKFPLTLDYTTVLAQLDGLVLDSRERRPKIPGCRNNCTINGEATAIGDALSKAYKRLEKSDGKSKVIVLVTDGNNNSGRLEPMDVARYIGDQPDAARVRVYTFLLASSRKTKTPALAQTFSGDIVLARQNGFLDYAPVDEGVDEKRVQEIADAARGVFHVSYDDDQFRTAFADLQKTEHLEQKIARYEELFVPFVLAAAGLFLLEFLLSVSLLRRFP